MEHVYTFDRDRYLMAMAAPLAHRNSLMALYAFNIEIAQICDSVSESILGEIRFQWWREQIANAFNDGPKPAGIAGELYDTIRTHNLSHYLFTQLLDNRECDLEPTPPETLDELVEYCKGTASTLIELSLEILNKKPGAGDSISELSHHTGIAWALCGLMRAIPYHLAHNRCYIPRDILSGEDIQWEYLHREDNRMKIPIFVELLAKTTNEHLLSARHAAKSVSAQNISSILSIPMTQHYLKTLRKAGFNPYDARVQQSHSVSKTLCLMWAMWRKRV